ncbi:MAG: hypothetical protein WCO94_03670 [Verrucomicrobiota bacterium]
MKHPILSMPRNLLSLTLAGALWIPAASAADAQSEWVHLAANGKLAYKTLPGGDRIIDFSHAGYGGGGVKLPVVSVEKTVKPSGGDDSAALEEAINAVAALPLKNGFRGAVLLAPGTFHCEKPITLTQDGIVVRGSGSGEKGTIIEMTGAAHTCLSIQGANLKFAKENPSDVYPVTDKYVPSGATSLSVKDAKGLKVGDTILVRWLRTAAWIHFMGMDNLVRNGKLQNWIQADSPIAFQRTIRAIEGNRITLDVPLTDSIDSRYLSANVIKTLPPKRLTQCGFESLRINSLPPTGTLTAPNNLAMSTDNSEDCWFKDILTSDTLGVATIFSNARRITLLNINALHTATVEKGAGYPADFTLRGSQVLIDRCSSKGDGAFFVDTAHAPATLNAALNCVFEGKGAIQPHQRWSTGLLIDSCKLPAGKIEFINRGTSGSGHGWAIGWAVAWNCTAVILEMNQPPGSMNWCIGCTGEMKKGTLPDSPWLSSLDKPVEPSSLYLAQLRERLGQQAVTNIGY